MTGSPTPSSTGSDANAGEPSEPSGLSSAGVSSATASAAGAAGPSGRQAFGAHELAIVLSHYDLGPIHKIKEFPRGSRKAPKLLIAAGSELYLLKRRARGKDDARKVAFCHEIQLHLAENQFPLPSLIGTRGDNNSMLQLGGQIYELFEYIKGSGYDSSLEATGDSGKVLALFHKLLSGYDPAYLPPAGSYHHANSVARSLRALGPTLTQANPQTAQQDPEAIPRVVKFFARRYQQAAQAADELGLPDWPAQVVHADWHPGNMLYRGDRVVAVIDYDAARIQQRIIDAANGALQFAILGGGHDPAQWPDYLDESRYKRFLRGYDAVPDAVLSRAELKAIPWLMIEALIAESVIPIAATGYFARMNGLDFLYMVQRKVQWLRQHADDLVAMAET